MSACTSSVVVVVVVNTLLYNVLRRSFLICPDHHALIMNNCRLFSVANFCNGDAALGKQACFRPGQNPHTSVHVRHPPFSERPFNGIAWFGGQSAQEGQDQR